MPLFLYFNVEFFVVIVRDFSLAKKVLSIALPDRHREVVVG